MPKQDSTIRRTIAIFLASSLWAALSHGAVGEVVSVRGKPFLMSAAKGAEAQLGPGDSVEAGDIVRTNEVSTAKILLADDTVLDVHASSALVVKTVDNPRSAERNVRLELERGRVRSKVSREVEKSKGKFEIHTKAAFMGVEGTDFVVEATDPSPDGTFTAKTSVLEGQVRVAAPAGSVLLGPGTQYTVTARLLKEAIEHDPIREEDIRKLEKPALDELMREARLSNDSFLQSIDLSGGGARFGISTRQSVSLQVSADRAAVGKKSDDDIFRKKFQTDETAIPGNLVDITVGFPQ